MAFRASARGIRATFVGGNAGIQDFSQHIAQSILDKGEDSDGEENGSELEVETVEGGWDQVGENDGGKVAELLEVVENVCGGNGIFLREFKKKTLDYLGRFESFVTI